jgi:hypothetical protein
VVAVLPTAILEMGHDPCWITEVTVFLSNCMKHSPYCEANGRSVTWGLPGFYGT